MLQPQLRHLLQRAAPRERGLGVATEPARVPEPVPTAGTVAREDHHQAEFAQDRADGQGAGRSQGAEQGSGGADEREA